MAGAGRQHCGGECQWHDDAGVPRNLSAALDVDVFSGDIRSVAGNVERREYGPGKHLKATLGAGNGDVKLESHSGSVRIDYTN